MDANRNPVLHVIEVIDMPWTSKHNPALQIVEVVYAGEITARELHESSSAFIALEKEKGINWFLVDATKMKLTASLLDVYDLPTKQYLEEKADRLGRVAVILPSCSKTREAVQFYETVCRNRGWMVQTFSKRQEAVDWLTYSYSSNNSDAVDVS